MSFTVEHKDGVHWADAPPPPRRHEHWAQTTGGKDGVVEVRRCACDPATVPIPVEQTA